MPGCYIRYSTRFFPYFFPYFLELKTKCCNLLSHNYFLFTFDRKCVKIVACSKWDGLNMNASSIGLGKKNDTVANCNYCSKDVSLADMEEAALTSH